MRRLMMDAAWQFLGAWLGMVCLLGGGLGCDSALVHGAEPDASARRDGALPAPDSATPEGDSSVPIPEAGLDAQADGEVPPARIESFLGGFGTDTRGGLDGRVIKVTTLADAGPGSLREAIDADGPRVIVFEVGGAIRLESDLSVSKPFVTIAGQTAPSPGISLYHGRFFIRTHDVVLQHFRIRPGERHANGSRISSDLADNRDAILIGTSARSTYNIVMDHLSLSWSIDETVSIWFNDSRDITLRDSILGEPLSVSIHPKSRSGVSHGYCFLVGNDNERISIIGSLFAHCTRRAPRLGLNTSSAIINTVHYNPVETAVHFQAESQGRAITAVASNVLIPGSNTKDNLGLLLNRNLGGQARAYLADNVLGGRSERTGQSVVELSAPEVWDATHVPMPSDTVEASVFDHAGARPRDRDSVDERIVRDARNRTGQRINFTDEVGGYPDLQESERPLVPPSDPQRDDDGDGFTNLEAWLASYSAEVE
ncbi:MAG: hypothetical protein AAGF12_09590 [Myxococcota bacterium]